MPIEPLPAIAEQTLPEPYQPTENELATLRLKLAGEWRARFKTAEVKKKPFVDQAKETQDYYNGEQWKKVKNSLDESSRTTINLIYDAVKTFEPHLWFKNAYL